MNVVSVRRLALALLATAAWSLPAQAQDCNMFCRAKRKLAELDSARNGASASVPSSGSSGGGESPTAAVLPRPVTPLVIGATGSTGAAQFGVIRLMWKVIDDGSALRAPAPPAVTDSMKHEKLGCGASRACAAGVDLRVLKVDTYRQNMAWGLPFVVDVTLENHGRVTSGAAEAVICTGALEAGRCGDGTSDSFVVPALAGESG